MGFPVPAPYVDDRSLNDDLRVYRWINPARRANHCGWNGDGDLYLKSNLWNPIGLTKANELGFELPAVSIHFAHAMQAADRSPEECMASDIGPDGGILWLTVGQIRSVLENEGIGILFDAHVTPWHGILFPLVDAKRLSGAQKGALNRMAVDQIWRRPTVPI